MSCDPGSTEFTVTPSPATSRASVFRKPVAPARAVLERMSVGMGWRTDTEVMATTRPQPAACIGGTSSVHMPTTESRFRRRAAS